MLNFFDKLAAFFKPHREPVEYGLTLAQKNLRNMTATQPSAVASVSSVLEPEWVPQPGSKDMSPAEFDAACRELLRRCPYLSESSGKRTPARNARVRGNPESKHLYGMARDFVADETNLLADAQEVAVELGFPSTMIHDKGTGIHLHLQGLSFGDIDPAWMLVYARSSSFETIA